MSEVKLTRRDIVVTTAVLATAFVGVPLLLWGLSSWRLANIFHTLKPEIEQDMLEHAPDANVMSTTIASENENGVLTYGKKTYPETNALVKEACDKLRTVIPDAISLDDWYSWDCFVISMVPNETRYIMFSKTSVSWQDKLNEEYAADIEGLLTRAMSEELPITNIHEHKEEREIHVVALLSVNPFLVWDVTFQLDDPSNR